MLKKILIISLIFFVLAVGVSVYILFFKKTTTKTPLDQANTDLPFGSSGNATNNGGTGQNNGGVRGDTTLRIPVDALMHLSTEPAGNGIVLETKTSTKARYADLASSHIFDVDLVTGVMTKISNTTIPKIQESYWMNNGSTTVLRYVSDNEVINTLNAQLVKTSSSSPDTTIKNELKGTLMSTNIDNLAISPQKTQMFYITTTSGGARGILISAKGASSQIWSSPVGEWLASWPSDNTIALTSKAASGVPGSMYFLSTSGTVKKVLGGVPGLTTLANPSLSTVAYSNDTARLYFYTIKTGSSQGAFVNTLSEKCVWSTKEKNIIYCGIPTSIPEGTYPNNWYQGRVSFTDDIYKINAVTGLGQLIVSLTGAYKQSIDVINPILSDSENYLLFTNKKDSTLWSYKLSTSTATTTR